MPAVTIMWNLMKRSIGTVRGFMTFIVIPAVAVSLSVLLFGGNSQDTIHRVHYVNEDDGPLGRYLIERLSRHPDYELFEVSHPDLLREKVFKLRTNEAFIIPDSFTEHVLEGRQAFIEQIYLNRDAKNTALAWMLNEQVDSMAAMVRTLTANGITDESDIVQTLERHWTLSGVNRVSGKIGDKVLWHRPEDDEIGEVNRIMVLFIMGIISQAIIVVVNDHQQRTIYRMYLAPIRTTDIVVGNFLGCFLMGTFQIILMLGITRYAMGFQYGGAPVVHQFVVLVLFLLASMGIACVVGTFFRDSHHIGLINVLVVLPTSMIGGCFWALDDMPEFMRKMANFVPQSWAIDAISTLEDGGRWTDISMNLLVLTAFAGVSLLFGAKIMRPDID